MTLDLNFVILLIGHLLADFYFQSNEMSKSKNTSKKVMVFHGIEYLVSIFVVLCIYFYISIELLFLGSFITTIHLVIDIIKKYFIKWKSKNSIIIRIQNQSFLIDQFIHIATLIAGWQLFGRQLTLYPYLTENYPDFPANPLLIILAILAILRPVGIMIDNGQIWDFSDKPKLQEANEQTIDNNYPKKDSGKMIGYLERIIIFVFMILHQYSAIAFVLTAKSIARYEKIAKEKMTADYYLIGTLLSIVSVIVIIFLLGLG